MTLRDLRIQSGKSVAEVAQDLNVTDRAYMRYEQGTRRISLEQIIVLTNLYDVTAEEVIQAQLNSCQSFRSNNQR